MRIVAGRHRGRRLAAPAGTEVRPTGDRVREALFNLLANRRYAGEAGPLPYDVDVLDAFAGTGALGLEALSRGAAHATFLEAEPEACRLIRRNVKALDEEARALVLRRDATRPGPAPRRHALALLDPPYRSGLAPAALIALASAGWLARGALCVVELDRREPFRPPPDFAAADERGYGHTRLVLLLYRTPAGID